LRSTVDNLAPFVGIEVQVLAQANLKFLTDQYGLANRAMMVVGHRRIPIVFPLGEVIPNHDKNLADTIERIRSGAISSVDVSGDILARTVTEYQVDWVPYLRSVIDAALTTARRVFETRHGSAIAEEVDAILEQKRLAEQETGSEIKAEVHGLANLVRA